jgi:hypothetical protein
VLVRVGADNFTTPVGVSVKMRIKIAVAKAAGGPRHHVMDDASTGGSFPLSISTPPWTHSALRVPPLPPLPPIRPLLPLLPLRLSPLPARALRLPHPPLSTIHLPVDGVHPVTGDTGGDRPSVTARSLGQGFTGLSWWWKQGFSGSSQMRENSEPNLNIATPPQAWRILCMRMRRHGRGGDGSNRWE